MKLDRRAFLGGVAAASVLSAAPGRFAAANGPAASANSGAWRVFEVKTRIEVVSPEGVSKAWIPLPSFAASDWIRPLGDQWQVEGGGQAERRQVGPYEVGMVTAVWPEGAEKPAIEVTSRVATRDRAIDLAQPGAVQPLDGAARELFTAPTKFIPTDGIVRETALRITAGATSDVEKARLIYDWVVQNTFRNPKTRGCGLGDIGYMLQSGDLGGKCADLNGLYVGLARAAGLPARDLYGIRVAPSRLGYKSLGANTEIISKSQHCRAEVYLSAFGWVPIDPADVRKVALEEPPGNLALESEPVGRARQLLFGAWETNWIAYNQAHDVILPGAKEAEIAFLMYPQVETAAGHRDCLDPDACKYTISSKEILA